MIYTFKPNQKVYNFILKNKNANKWQCQCICGNHIDVNEMDLFSGNVQSCGCRDIEINKLTTGISYSINIDSSIEGIYPSLIINNLTVIE